ncbi:hypothetical protein BLSTO_03438, partial [Blastocystis sp. subtype 1]
MELGLSSTLQELRVLLSGRESNAWEEYWKLMRKKVHLQLSEADYVRLLLPIIGKENLPLHNRIVMSIVRSALRRQREKQCRIRKQKRIEKNNANAMAHLSASLPSPEQQPPPNTESKNLLTFLTSCSVASIDRSRCQTQLQELSTHLDDYCKFPLSTTDYCLATLE